MLLCDEHIPEAPRQPLGTQLLKILKTLSDECILGANKMTEK